MEDDKKLGLLQITADIVSAYVQKQPMRATELPELIAAVHSSFCGLSQPKVKLPIEELKPAVPIKKSVTTDYLICLEDGKKFKSLKRHLQSAYGMTPNEYRSKWGLPHDYPMVAPGYAAKRSELAKSSGLGSFRRTVGSPAAPVRAAVAVAPAKKRGRPSKKAA